MPRVVYVYSGEGSSQRSILSTIESLKATLHGVQEWPMLVLCVDFAVNGGAYMGICAGAYFACRRVEFELNKPLEVKGGRELAFFPGVGKGAVQRGFAYGVESGTAAVPVRFKDPRNEGEWLHCSDYSNGGPAFVPDEAASDTVEILAEYRREDIKGAAAVKCQVGAGVAVLSGTHPELGFRWLDPHCHAEYIQRANPGMSEPEVIKLVLQTTKLRAILSEEQEKREELWKSLLVAAGLVNHIRWTKTSIELQRCQAKKLRIQLDALLTPATMTISK